MAASSRTRITRNPLTLAVASALLLSSGALMAQTTQSSTQSKDDADDKAQTTSADGKTKTLEQVTVVGSRIKKVDLEGPAPVTIITKEQIEREGFTTVADMLQSLSQNTSRSFTGDQAVTGFSPNAQVVNLRQLGPGYTLTLVNGRRPAEYPQPYNRDRNVVNVRAIPLSIIERTETLTGGASAIYGSDAVAGVVNIVTRQNFDGHTARIRWGTTEEGGGDSLNLEYSGGKTGDRWSALWAFQASETKPVFADQRDFLADTRNGPNGAAFTNPNLAMIAIRGTAFGGGASGTNAYYPGQAACDAFGYTTVTTATRGQYCGSYTQSASRSISNLYKFWSSYGRVTFDLTDNTQFFANATYYDSNAKASAGTEFWGTSGDRFNTTRAGAATAFYYDPQFGGVVQLQRIFNPFELGGEEAASTLFDEVTWDVTAGLSGSFGERFDWELAATHSRYDYRADRPRLLAKGVHDYFLGPLLGYASTTGATTGSAAIYPIYRLNLNRWSTPWTPEIYNSVSTRVITEGETSSSSLGFTVTGDLFDMPAGPVGFAGIIEGTRQTMDLNSDPRTDPLRPADDQTIYNLVSSGRTEGDRNRYAVGAEFRIPLLTQLTAQVAGRYDKYEDISDIGGAFTYNLGLEYRPMSNFLVRSSFATSFRAPDLQLIYSQGSASFASALDQYACFTGTGVSTGRGERTYAQCNVSADPTIYTVQTTIAGNPALKEEKGKSFTGGFVWDISDNMSMSMDYYRVKLEDAASQLGSFNILESEAACRLGKYQDNRPPPSDAFCASVLPLVTRVNAPGTPQDGQISRINDGYVNTALTDTSGIDASWNYRHETPIGTFRFGLDTSLLLTYKFKRLAAESVFDYRDTNSISQRSRARGSISWSREKWNATLFGQRYGSAKSNSAVNGVNTAGVGFGDRLAPYMTYNLNVGYKFSPALSFDLSIVNLTNNQYRFDASNTAYPFYNYALGSDPLGRRYYLGATYKF